MKRLLSGKIVYGKEEGGQRFKGRKGLEERKEPSGGGSTSYSAEKH